MRRSVDNKPAAFPSNRSAEFFHCFYRYFNIIRTAGIVYFAYAVGGATYIALWDKDFDGGRVTLPLNLPGVMVTLFIMTSV